MVCLKGGEQIAEALPLKREEGGPLGWATSVGPPVAPQKVPGEKTSLLSGEESIVSSARKHA